MFNKISSIFSVLFMKIHIRVYPFQMEFHGVMQVYPWSHEMYPQICLAIFDPKPFLGVAKCIQGSI